MNGGRARARTWDRPDKRIIPCLEGSLAMRADTQPSEFCLFYMKQRAILEFGLRAPSGQRPHGRDISGMEVGLAQRGNQVRLESPRNGERYRGTFPMSDGVRLISGAA